MSCFFFSCLGSVELVWIKYGWLDPLGRGYVGNHTGGARWSRHDTMLYLAQIWEIFTEVENCWEREKDWEWSFLRTMEERNKVVDSPLELSTVEKMILVQVNRASTVGILSCQHHFIESWDLSEFEFAIDKPLGMSTVFYFWVNLRWFLKLFLFQIQSFLFSFLRGLHAYIKRGYSSCYCILYLIDLIRYLSPSVSRK